jgi:hypothetical protein
MATEAGVLVGLSSSNDGKGEALSIGVVATQQSMAKEICSLLTIAPLEAVAVIMKDPVYGRAVNAVMNEHAGVFVCPRLKEKLKAGLVPGPKEMKLATGYVQRLAGIFSAHKYPLPKSN